MLLTASLILIVLKHTFKKILMLAIVIARRQIQTFKTQWCDSFNRNEQKCLGMADFSEITLFGWSEPCNGKLLSTVLKTSEFRDGLAEFTRMSKD